MSNPFYVCIFIGIILQALMMKMNRKFKSILFLVFINTLSHMGLIHRSYYIAANHNQTSNQTIANGKIVKIVSQIKNVTTTKPRKQ